MEKTDGLTIGSVFRKERLRNNHSIKQLAPKLNVNYSYISKIENGHTLPSEDLIAKFAEVFNLDKDELMIRAGKIPDDVIDIISNNPKEAIDFLRRKFRE